MATGPDGSRCGGGGRRRMVVPAPIRCSPRPRPGIGGRDRQRGPGRFHGHYDRWPRLQHHFSHIRHDDCLRKRDRLRHRSVDDRPILRHGFVRVRHDHVDGSSYGRHGATHDSGCSRGVGSSCGPGGDLDRGYRHRFVQRLHLHVGRLPGRGGPGQRDRIQHGGRAHAPGGRVRGAIRRRSPGGRGDGGPAWPTVRQGVQGREGPQFAPYGRPSDGHLHTRGTRRPRRPGR